MVDYWYTSRGWKSRAFLQVKLRDAANLAERRAADSQTISTILYTLVLK